MCVGVWWVYGVSMPPIINGNVCGVWVYGVSMPPIINGNVYGVCGVCVSVGNVCVVCVCVFVLCLHESAIERVFAIIFISAGDHTKITLNTKNVFIDITATDLNKVSNYGVYSGDAVLTVH